MFWHMALNFPIIKSHLDDISSHRVLLSCSLTITTTGTCLPGDLRKVMVLHVVASQKEIKLMLGEITACNHQSAILP